MPTYVNIYIYISKYIISISKWNHQWLYLNLIQSNSLPLQKHKTYLDIPTYVHALHYITLKYTTIQYNTITYNTITYIHNFPDFSSFVFLITQTPQPRHIVHGESTTRWRQFFRFFGQGCSLFPWAGRQLFGGKCSRDLWDILWESDARHRFWMTSFWLCI